MTETDPEFLKQLQEAFVIEAREQLQSFMNSVINLESSQTEQEKQGLAEAMLHELHSMKGNSRAAGITSAEAICQALESAIFSLRRQKELLKPEAADVFHSAIDLLDELIRKVENGQPDFSPDTFSDTLQRLKVLDERQRMVMEAASRIPATPLAATAAPSQTADPANPLSVALPGSGPPISSAGTTTAASSTGGPAATSSASATAPTDAKAARTQGATDKNVSTRIALWKLNKILRESEEMLMLKQISEQHLEDIRDIKALSKMLSSESLRLQTIIGAHKSKTGDELSEKDILAFADSIKSLSKEFEQSIVSKNRRQQSEQRLCFNMVDGFIDSVKSLLMQDFSLLLSVVPKIVRDLSRELKKDIELEIFGTEIEIDRRILEEIKDPLIHLIRNSLDHGIETSEERLANGKAAKASLRIGARKDESGNVQLLICDDGKGINTKKLKLAAIREGAISAEEAETLSENDAIELMYRSSVSTSETVNEISGRGIGMAIVRERIHDLGGHIFVETLPGQGTTFILQLPTKLSTFRGIQVMAAGQSFIIPTLHVHHAGRIQRSDIKKSGSRNVAYVNGQLIPVQALADVLKLTAKHEFRERHLRNYQQLLILESGDSKAGFIVDEILHEHEVLVRGLSYPLVRVPNISGATILGSGQVVPVLNIGDLIETSSKASWADEKLAQQLDEEQKRIRKLSATPVFLVDQHLTSLVMLSSLLKSEGYIVNTFASNESALAGLDVDIPLILLKNSDLPETQENGLANYIRKDLRLKDLPIIFFGSSSAQVGEEFSKKQGGNAYFSKADFDRRQVLQMIERLT